MSQGQDKLSNIEVMILVASAVIGVVILTLPRLATEAAKIDGTVATFLGGIASLGATIMIAFLCKRHPNQTIVEYAPQLVGGILGRIVGAVLIFYTILVAGAILRAFSDALKILMLPKTPLEFIMITMLFTVVYLTQHGIGAIAKISESFIPLVLAALLLLLVLNLQNFNLDEFRPVFSKGLIPILKAVPNLMIAYLGFEVILFVAPFMKNPSKVVKFSTLGIAIPIIVYTSLVGICVGVFKEIPTRNLVYPTVMLAKQINFPGAFAERFDIFFMILWILGAYTSLVIYNYLSAFSITRIMGLRNYRPFIFLLLPIIYLVAILPQNIFQIDMLSTIAGYIGGALIFGVIPLLLVISVIRGRKRKNA